VLLLHLNAIRSKLFFMTDLGKFLMLVGALLVAAGLVLVFLGKTNLPLGKLPGDIVYRGKHTTVYLPLATSILLSVVLSAVLYIISRFRR
jgi:hypothetical protein